MMSRIALLQLSRDTIGTLSALIGAGLVLLLHICGRAGRRRSGHMIDRHVPTLREQPLGRSGAITNDLKLLHKASRPCVALRLDKRLNGTDTRSCPSDHATVAALREQSLCALHIR